MADVFDYKKEYRDLYSPKNEPMEMRISARIGSSAKMSVYNSF